MLKGVFLLIMCLVLSGCVYLRLHRGLRQLKAPDEFIEFSESNGFLKVRLKKPIVRLADLEFVLGNLPSQVQDNHYRYVFSKSGVGDRLPWKIDLWVDRKSRLAEFRLPKKLNQVLGKVIIIEAIGALGKAKLSVIQKKLSMQMKAKINRKQLDELMGKPLRIQAERCFYHFIHDGKEFLVTVWVEKWIRKIRFKGGDAYIEIFFNHE